MYRIGIDVGSTFTKYCIREDEHIVDLFMERTPIRQNDYFRSKIEQLEKKYANPIVVSCGYGKSNVHGMEQVNELTALAKGSYELCGNCTVLDIGGQDTKIIVQEKGKIKSFFVNDKCAAGSGMFLINTLNMLGVDFFEIRLNEEKESIISLSSACAVFAQSEIIKLIVGNVKEIEIINAVINQILIKAKPLLVKVNNRGGILSGGISQIRGFDRVATRVFGEEWEVIDKSAYISAIGCTID